MQAQKQEDVIELDIDPTEFETRLGRGDRLLISFGATWCGPCKQLMPTLRRLAAELEGDLGVGRIETDLHPGVGDPWKISAYPTLILFSGGRETARLVGLQTLGFLREWITRKLPPKQPTGSLSRLRPDWGAFYGNTLLRNHLFADARALATAGKLGSRRQPGWYGDAGSVWAALVRSSSPLVFERITGLPYSFAAALELINPANEAGLQALVEALEVDLDVTQIYLRLLVAWLGDKREHWDEYVPAAINSARLNWLATTQLLLEGGTVARDAWAPLGETLRTAARTIPEADAGRCLGILIAEVSPPPDVDTLPATYDRLMALGQQTRYRLSQRQAGVTAEVLALDQRVHEWFLGQWSIEAYQALSDEERQDAHRRLSETFAREFAERDTLEAVRQETSQACSARLTDHLASLLKACPKISTAPADTTT